MAASLRAVGRHDVFAGCQAVDAGMARLRFWLIMLMRMVAIAVLFVAVARPLTTGWLGVTIGRRPIPRSSCSTARQAWSNKIRKRGVRSGPRRGQAGERVRSVGSGSRVVLIESTSNIPQELESPEALEKLIETSPTATAADIPAMLQKALEYVVANQTGRTDIWVCSDRGSNDWNSDDGRWATARDGFQRLKAVRFIYYVLPNRRRQRGRARDERAEARVGKDRELMFDVTLRREPGMTSPIKLSMELIVNGARSVIKSRWPAMSMSCKGKRCRWMRRRKAAGAGLRFRRTKTLQDNISYFVFSDPPMHHTTIVAEKDPRSRRHAASRRWRPRSGLDLYVGHADAIARRSRSI